MTVGLVDALQIPGFGEPLSLELSPPVAALREKALEFQREGTGHPAGLVERTLIDARSWAAHTDDEDWLVWRGRRCAERLRYLPLDIEPGEKIVGKPLFRQPNEEDMPRIERANEILSTMPPFPGGDSGHFHPNYEKLFRLGIGGILDQIIQRENKAEGPDAKNFYRACRIAMEGMRDYAIRTAEACEEMDPDLAAICRRVSTAPPETFYEALELMFLAQIALWFGDDHGLTSPGRMDQTLARFYEADRAAARLTRREALELISCLYIQMNRILYPGSAVAVMVGGRDAQGRDMTNEITYLCLAARQATQLVYPTVGLAWHEGTPPECMDFCVQVLASGIGDPAIFNDKIISQGLRDHGVTGDDCHNFMNSTCVEIKIAGASNIWVTAPYYNLPQGLLDVMREVGEERGPAPSSFEDLQQRVRANLSEKIRVAAERLDQVWAQRARAGCFPLASCFIRDCLEKGQDFDRGGARYNWVENSFVGLANLADSLIAVQKLVYERKELTLAEFYKILQEDFEGREDLRLRLCNTLPKYGNDDDTADQLAKDWAEFLIAETQSHTVGIHKYVPGFFCWVMHERLGSDTGATPDGRHSGWPLADGAGAAQGREKEGPTASILSTTKWAHQPVLGGLVHNAKFSRSLFKSRDSRKAMCNLIETFMRRGGFELQVNVVSKDVLLDAQKHPEQYQDLLVRVAGYSDYFVHLNRKMQEEVIARTEHEF